MEITKTSTIFSTNLKRLLEEKEISQAELSRRIDVTPSAVSLWICGRGDPKISKIDKLCTVLHCTRADLLEEHPAYQAIFKSTQEIKDRNPKLRELEGIVSVLSNEGLAVLVEIAKALASTSIASTPKKEEIKRC